MTDMPILTVRPPWAQAIIFGGKNVENRSRNLAGDYRGTIAIHAGKTVATLTRVQEALLEQSESSQIQYWLDGEPIIGGVILGVVDLVDVHRAEGSDAGIVADMIRDAKPFALNGACSPWAEANMHHLVLANPRPLSEPIPYKGALGLRRLPDDVVERVLAGVQS